MDEIYLVTTLYLDDQSGTTKRRRCVGWFPHLSTATAVVALNKGDIWEIGHYNHCVIERTLPGLYPHVEKEYWFKWNEEDGKFRLVDKPAYLENCVNFGIG